MRATPGHGRATLRANYGWIVFSVMLAAYFFVYFQRMSVSVVGSDIVGEVGGSIGYLSSAYFWAYTAMQIPSGLLADRIGPRRAGAIFMSIAAAGSLLTFAADSFAAVVAGKIMIAVGMAVVYIPLMKLVSVWFPARDFAVLSGIVIAVGNVGAIAASGPLALLADAIGWRDVFLVLGAVTLTLAALCALVVRDSPGGEIDKRERVPVLRGLRLVFSGGRRFWNCALAYFLVYGTIMTFQGTWAVKYFDSVYGFALSAAWMVTAIGVGKIASTVAVGAMVSRGILRSKRRTMMFGTGCFAVVWVIIYAFAGDIGAYWFWFSVSLLFGFFGGFMSLSFAQVKEWYPISVAGTAVAGMNVFLFLGASVSTAISGAIVGTAYTLGNFSALWGLMLVFAAAAFVLIVLSREKGPDDAEMTVEAGH